MNASSKLLFFCCALFLLAAPLTVASRVPGDDHTIFCGQTNPGCRGKAVKSPKVKSPSHELASTESVVEEEVATPNLCATPVIFADGLEPPQGAASCEMFFIPQALGPSGRATLQWSAQAVDQCMLSCNQNPVLAAVSAQGSRSLKASKPVSCDLCCIPPMGMTGTTAGCSASLPVEGSCDAPSCTATVHGSADAGYALSVATDGQRCAYSCPGFGSGEMACDADLPLGSETRECRVWAVSACDSVRRCSTSSWSASITVDGNLDDWPSGTRFPTNGGYNHISWDDDYIYVALNHQALVQAVDELSVMVYLGNGAFGLPNTKTLGTQTCTMPVSMSHAVRWQPAIDAYQLLEAIPGHGWIPTPVSGLLVSGNSRTGSVEMAVPRALLSLNQYLYVHANIVDHRSGQEISFASTPFGSHRARYMGNGSLCKKVAKFDVNDWLQPNDTPPYEIGPFDFPEVTPPLENTGFSLRIATFNGAYVDIPDGESDLEAHVAATCALGSLAAPVLQVGVVATSIALGMPPVWLGLPPPDPLLWFGFCEAGVHIAIDYFNSSLEEEAGGDLSHEQRALEIAARLLEMDLDVVALNEVFVEDARDQLVSLLESKYPYVVTRIEPPADTDVTDIFEPHFGAYFVQDSGLMLFSRYPFTALSNLGHLVTDDQVELRWQGSTVNNSSKQALAFLQFNAHPCHKEDCNAGKGVAAVRIEKSPQQQFAVAFSHMQASYGADDSAEQTASMDIRGGQLGDAKALINDSFTTAEKDEAEVFFLGDLNIVGRHSDGESLNANDWPDWDQAHFDFTGFVTMSSEENLDWDLGRQEWLHHFCGLRTGLPGEACENANPGESHLDDPTTPGFFACGDGATSECPDSNGNLLLVDSWAYDTSAHDLGRTQGAGAWEPTLTDCVDEGVRLKTSLCSGSRLDYILHNKPEISGHGATSVTYTTCAQHMTIAYELSGAGGTQPLSDHLPIRGDFNIWSPHCRPPEAVIIDEAVLEANDNTFIASSATNSDYKIKYPGSMQWFRIEEPGSYSIGVGSDPEMDFMVYQEEDLSRPRPSYHKMKSEWGTRYYLPKPPYYVRVFATKDAAKVPDREKTGNYLLKVHRHDCTKAWDACAIQAGSWLAPILWPDKHFTVWDLTDPHYEAGPDALWFILTTYVDDKGVRPSLSFGHESRWPDNYSMEIAEFCGTSGDCPGPHEILVSSDNFDTGPKLTGCELCKFFALQLRAETTLKAPDGKQGKAYFLRVLRTVPLGPDGTDCPVEPCGTPKKERTAGVRFGTNLTFFYPDTLELILSEDDFGGDVTDELYYFLDVDGQSPTKTKTSNYQWLGNFVEGGPKGSVSKMTVRSYVENMHPNIYSAAEPNASVDDTDPEWFVPRPGHYLCQGADPEGSGELCALPEEWLGSSMQLNGNLAEVMYSDDPQGNEDNADYKAILRYCLVHEYFEKEGTLTALDACRAVGLE